jgi:cobaltochelatase CobS
MGDSTGMYHGTQSINQAQLDRWSIATTLNYLSADKEGEIVQAKAPELQSEEGGKLVGQMVKLAGLTRVAFQQGDLSTLMSPRTVITWAENHAIFGDVHVAFAYTFYNKCDPLERETMAELYQRVFNFDLPKA